MEAETHKHGKINQDRSISCKQNKETEASKTWIMVSKHEYACTYIGSACVAQL